MSWMKPSKKRRNSATEEARSKHAHDRSSAGGSSKAWVSKDDYRRVPATSLTNIQPGRMYDGQLKDVRVTTRSEWKDIPRYGSSILKNVFPREVPQLGSFLLLDVSGKMAAAGLHQILARVCEGSSRFTKNFFEAIEGLSNALKAYRVP